MCVKLIENIIKSSYQTKNKPKYMESCASSVDEDIKNHKAINLIQITDIVNVISKNIPTRFFPYNSIYFF